MPSRPLRVLHFISNSAESDYFTALARHTDKTRFQLSLAILEPRRPMIARDLITQMDEAGIPVLLLDCEKRRHLLRAAWRLARHLRENDIDVIQTYLFYASVVGALAARLSGRTICAVTGHHCMDILLQKKRFPSFVNRVTNRFLTHYLLAPTDFVRRSVLAEDRVPDRKILVMPAMIDLADWNFDANVQARVRKELGVEGKTVFGSAGRIYWMKNYAGMLRAFAEIKDPNAVFVAVGGDVGGELVRLRQLADSLGISDRVVFTGYYPRIREALMAFDVYVHASLTEAFGQTIMEAMALSRPIVSTAVGVAEAVVRSGENGFSVPPGNQVALTHALQAIEQAHPQWVAMGRRSRELITPFDAAAVVPQYEALYESWCK